MVGGQRSKTMKQIVSVMELLGVNEYTIGPQKHDHPGARAEERE